MLLDTGGKHSDLPFGVVATDASLLVAVAGGGDSADPMSAATMADVAETLAQCMAFGVIVSALVWWRVTRGRASSMSTYRIAAPGRRRELLPFVLHHV